ncbi:peptidase [Klebsiella michiganensis]|uniref:Peptidase n=1 Tax=Klebsiella michiganensis TaxID=1134687 RepID=A0A7H4N2D0_9ENTR|nr:peptidase [Klebsiella michiganensis]
MNYSICINTATGFLNRNGTWKVWRAGWKIPSDPRRKESCLHPGEVACESNVSRGYSAATFWASYAQQAFAATLVPDNALAYRYVDGSPVFQNPDGTRRRDAGAFFSAACAQQPAHFW